MNVLFALPLLLLPIVAAAQDPTDVLARFQLDGKPAVVTRGDVAIEMAFRLLRRDRGREACGLLVDATLTRRAATAKNLMPSTDEVRAFWQRLQQQLREAGSRPEDFAAVRNTSEQQWFADLAVQMAQERLVRAELGLAPTEAVSPDMLKLWLQEERRKHKVVFDPDHLPTGSCARVGDTEVPIADLGALLLRTSEDAERDRFVRELIYLRSLETLAQQQGVHLTDADLDQAVQRRRDDAARDPRYQGIPLEQMLKAEGLTIVLLRDLRTFRGQVLLDKLASRHFPDPDLQAEIARDRQDVLDRVGPRRHLGLILVRALEQPNALVPLDFPAAEQKLRQVRARLSKETFANVASIESEDDQTKTRGGDAGWHRRRSGELPDALLAAAFVLPAGEVSEPVRSEEGCWLVKVLEVDAMPPDHRLIELLRRYRALEMQQQILRGAAIEMLPAADATPR
jgi:hypothetical protein